MRATIALALCAACRIPNEQFPVTDAPPADGPGDAAASDGPAVRCNLGKPFDPPVPIVELNDAQLSEQGVRLTHDELVVYFWTRPAGVSAGGDLVTASRSTAGGTFGPTGNLAIDDPSVQRDPSVLESNKTLYFSTDAATPGTDKIYTASRPSTSVDFSNPAPVAILDTGTGDDEIDPYVMGDDQQIYLAIEVMGTTTYQLYASRRVGGAYVKPYKNAFANIDDAAQDQRSPVVTPDLLTLYFESPRPGGMGAADIWKATRASASNGFGPPVNVTELNTADSEVPGWISDDGCRLYFARGQPAQNNYQLFVASKPPM